MARDLNVTPCWLLPEHVTAREQHAAGTELDQLVAMQPLVVTSGPAYYPKADRTTQWFGNTYPGVDMGGVTKLLWHTTETGTWPSYSGGASAPTLTFNPETLQWRQHFPLYRSARALRDPDYTLVRENRDKVVQVEIIATSDRGFAERYGYTHVEDLSEAALRELGLLFRFLHVNFGTPYRSAPTWLPYPESYGNSAARMTGPEFDGFTGQCAHQHASGNSHGDCNPDYRKILAYAQGVTPPEDDLPTPAEVWAYKLDDPHDGVDRPAGDLVRYARIDAYKAYLNTIDLEKAVAELAAKVEKLQPPEPPPA